LSGARKSRLDTRGRPFGGGFLLGRIDKDGEVIMSYSKTEIEFSNLKRIIKVLKEHDKNYLASFYKEAKQIGKPVQDEIIQAIPATSPIRGMRARSNRARLGWGIGKRAKSVVIRANRTVQRKSSFAQGKHNKYPIVQVVAQSPALIVADMAGKSNKVTNKKPLSRSYEINLFGRGVIVTRTHKINGQGLALIERLASAKGVISSSPSRYFYPAAERAMPAAKKEMQSLINQVNETANKYLGT